MSNENELRQRLRRLQYGQWPDPEPMALEDVPPEAVAIPYLALAHLREAWEFKAAVWLFARAPRRAIVVQHLGGYLGEVWGCTSTEARAFLRKMDRLGLIELRAITAQGHRYRWRITFGRKEIDTSS